MENNLLVIPDRTKVSKEEWDNYINRLLTKPITEQIRLDIGTYRVNLSKQLMDDLLIWGECAYKISDQGIERLKPNTFITNGK